MSNGVKKSESIFSHSAFLSAGKGGFTTSPASRLDNLDPHSKRRFFIGEKWKYQDLNDAQTLTN